MCVSNILYVTSDPRRCSGYWMRHTTDTWPGCVMVVSAIIGEIRHVNSILPSGYLLSFCLNMHHSHNVISLCFVLFSGLFCCRFVSSPLSFKEMCTYDVSISWSDVIWAVGRMRQPVFGQFSFVFVPRASRVIVAAVIHAAWCPHRANLPHASRFQIRSFYFCTMSPK